MQYVYGFVNVRLGDCCKFVRGPFGGSLKKEIFVSSGYAVYEQQNAIYNKMEFRYFVDENKYKKMLRFSVKSNDLIMSCPGTMGKVAIIPYNAPAGIINQALLKITPNEIIKSEYLKYLFDSEIFNKQILAGARGGAIQNVASVEILKTIIVPLPSITEQERIVGILDKFDVLVNDLTQGLPAEIEARTRQYEYYRDKLLTFKRKS